MELETTTKMPLEKLRLDRGNPRLVSEAAYASDQWISLRARDWLTIEVFKALDSGAACSYRGAAAAQRVVHLLRRGRHLASIRPARVLGDDVMKAFRV